MRVLSVVCLSLVVSNVARVILVVIVVINVGLRSFVSLCLVVNIVVSLVVSVFVLVVRPIRMRSRCLKKNRLMMEPV